MKATKFFASLLALTLGAASAQTVTTYPTPSTSNLELGLTGGYYNGGGAQFFVGMRDLYGPIGVRLSGSFASNNNGFDEDVAFPLLGSIKTQKASGLVDDTKGKSTVIGLDATYDIGSFISNIDTTVYGGLRYGHFTSTIDYKAGGSTDYTSNRFGMGVGVEASYPITNNFSIIGNLGGDYFFKGDIKSDDGTNTDTFDADDAKYVSQPGGLFKAGLGIKYRF